LAKPVVCINENNVVVCVKPGKFWGGPKPRKGPGENTKRREKKKKARDNQVSVLRAWGGRKKNQGVDGTTCIAKKQRRGNTPPKYGSCSVGGDI